MKMLVCDMDQTLINFSNKPTSWSELSFMLGVNNKELYNRYINDDDYSYIEFTEDTVKAYINNNIKRNHINKLKSRMILKSGYKDLIDFAESRNMDSIIITGGIGNIAEHLCQNHGFDNYYSSCYFRFDSDASISNYSINEVGGSNQKFRKMRDHISGSDVNMSDIIFVGDDINDMRMIEEVGYSFNIGDKDIGADHKIECLSDVRKILD